MTKTQKIAASEARNNFSELVSQVQYQGKVFLIERYGEVVAKLVPAQEAESGSSLGKPITQEQTTETEKIKQESSAGEEKKEAADYKTSLDALEELIKKSQPRRIEVETQEEEKKEETNTETDEAVRPVGLGQLKSQADAVKEEKEESDEDLAQRKAERIEIIRKKIELLMEE